jgi:threonine aldolase
MYQFRNDYSYGAAKPVLDAIAAVSAEGCTGYGADSHCIRAAQLIRTACAAPDARVEFCMGGTQTNFLTIAAFLRPWEGVISAESGHINGHEAGAVEAAGHKILSVKTGTDGKLTPDLLSPLLTEHQNPHLVKPALVYLSQATEMGAVYTKAELTALRQFCHVHGLKLFLDGARLGAALTSSACDMTLPDVAALTDAFYLGGTKNGALFGEALVLCDPALSSDFFRLKKQRGAVLAKGFLLGAQFEALFQNGLYWDLSRHANAMAERLQNGIRQLDLPLWVASPTNQIFVIVPDSWLPRLETVVSYEVWGKADETHTIVRFVTCFATQEADVDGLLSELARFCH